MRQKQKTGDGGRSRTLAPKEREAGVQIKKAQVEAGNTKKIRGRKREIFVEIKGQIKDNKREQSSR